MAEEKKSFILYADLINVLVKLDDENAGKLFKHILEYVNDLDPTPENVLIDIVFEPIKQQMKRDLRKWEGKKVKQSNSGTLGNLKRWNPDLFEQVENQLITLDEALVIATRRKESQPDSTQSPPIGSVAVNDNVNVNVNVNDNVIKKEKAFNFRLSLIELGVEEQIVVDWLKVRKTKKATNTETAFNNLLSQIEKSGKSANECITLCVVNSWSGFKAEYVKPSKPNESWDHTLNARTF
jgi:hypothetical protein